MKTPEMPKSQKGAGEGEREREREKIVFSKKPIPNIRLNSESLNASFRAQEQDKNILSSLLFILVGVKQWNIEKKKKNRTHTDYQWKNWTITCRSHDCLYKRSPQNTRSNEFGKITGYKLIYKNQLYFFLVHILITPKWIKNLNVRAKIRKFLKENKGVNLLGIGKSNGFLNTATKEKINCSTSKLNTFLFHRIPSKKWKTTHRRENICQPPIWWVTYLELLQLKNKTMQF